ncbi:thioesterase family protein [Aneurinibacillus terranovensis]|uniref:thioesterase family protein n=1 Tax=Aneurinibacillus terranovensis TaxID=278991 RepID=UPI0003F9DB0E|nr:thioesterase [Aneurinibacillus terranovensis]
MKEGLVPGITADFSIIVEESMMPAFDGEVVHPVLSTVSMIYYMEKAGRYVILPYLEDDEEGAGFSIDIKHIGPAVVGQVVRFKAVCTEVNEKRVVCEVTAHTNLNIVGQGSFIQAFFKKTDMAKRIERIQEQIRIGS